MHDQTKHGRFSAHVYEKPETVTLRVDPSEAVFYIKRIQTQRQKYKQFFSGLESIDIDYEEMVAGSGLKPQISEAICDFLNVDRSSLISTYVKSNPAKLDEFVINYKELIDFVSNSGCGGDSDYV